MARSRIRGWAGRLIGGFYAGWEALLATMVHVMPFLLLAYAGVIVLALFQSSQWPFALRAQTRIVELDLDGRTETRWDVSSAVLCLRSPLAATPPSYRVVDTRERIRRYCGSRRWHAYAPASGRYAPEFTAVMGGNAAKSTANSLTRISSIGGNRIIMDIDKSPSSDETPTITIVGSGGAMTELGAPISFNWLTDETNGPLLFPFSGSIRVGQDVNTTRRELLESGSISVFSPSGQEVGGRALVESIDLLPGDMVDLSAAATGTDIAPSADASASRPAFARGFVRITAKQMTESRPVMEVLAFGQSSSVRVRRFGEAGLDFKPGIWARLTHDDRVVTATLLLVGLLSLLASVAEARGLAARHRP